MLRRYRADNHKEIIVHFIELLQKDEPLILDEALRAVRRAHMYHYEIDGLSQTELRLKLLYSYTLQSVAERNLAPILRHTETIAHERFAEGYDLSEVQTAINVLEEAIWKRLLTDLEPTELVEGLGLISTALGAAKDRLACTYLAMTQHKEQPQVNYASLFGGSVGA